MHHFYLKDRTLIIVFVVCLFSFKVSAQNNKLSFKTILQNSIEYKTQKENSLVCEFKGEKTLVKLLAKDHWKVEELDSLDCILENYSDKIGIGEKAILNFIGGTAYMSYDDDLKKEFFQKAYLGFESMGDIVGMFFSSAELFGAKTKTSDPDIESFSKDLVSSFKELEELNKKTNYPPARLTWYDMQIRKAVKLEDTLPKATLEKMASEANSYATIYPNYARHLYSSLSSIYRRQKEIDKVLI